MMFVFRRFASSMARNKKMKTPPPTKIKKLKKHELSPMPVFEYPVSQVGEKRIYVWGLANHGALGTLGRTRRKDDFDFIPKPSRLYFGEHFPVSEIVCGYGFTVFGVKPRNKNHIVYGTGINTDSQLGFTVTDRRHRTHTKNQMIAVPRAVPLPLKNNSSSVVDLAAGRAHLLVLTTEGLFTLGNNSYGQCGRPVIIDEDYFESCVIHHIPNVDDCKIVQVAAGQDHSMLITENGEVYSCGWGADGQTGLGHYKNQWKLDRVQGELKGHKIVKIACAADCVLALSDEGRVFGWGNAEYGQLPIENDINQVNSPVELSDCVKFGKIIDIAAGGSFCMVLTSSGDVYVWGYGILGFGPEVNRIPFPRLLPSTLFGKNPYQPDIKVTQVHCGLNQLAAVTNTGDLYTWGANKFGALGLGHCDDQFFPLKVPLGGSVEKVSIGVDHMVVLCKPFV